MIRFDLTDTGDLIAHGSTGPRNLRPAEIEMIREALEPKPLPWWLDAGAVVMGFLALVVLGRGGGA